ncbi:DoxX family protein [Variibacter gotjawalensis]|uniref:DoxX family protein n=1 Tax=Variibacter gotjawalensis TaxID=1333996 RepID=UPI001D916635|nr:hypothetical protein [Variibacter gotjawalensis]NIK49850.1 putative membrane protein [Variibacter gotjawalensis]
MRIILRWVLAIFFFLGGVLHLVFAEKVLLITPAWVPYPSQVIWLTGLFEFAAAIGLLFERSRAICGLLLAAYALAVWPANFHHAFTHFDPPVITNSWAYHAPRLALQPVIIWAALFCAGWVSWPLRGPGGGARLPPNMN